MYCRAGLTISYDGYIAAQKKARIEVSSGKSYDVFDVYEGSNFMDGRCIVRRIEINQKDGETGRVIGSCSGKQFVLELKTHAKNESDVNSVFVDGKAYPVDKIGGKYWVDLGNHTDSDIRGNYYFDGENLVKEGEAFIMNSTSNGSMSDRQKVFYNALYGAIKTFAISDSGGNAVPKSAQYFEEAIQSYERVVDDYPSEGDGIYGKEALQHGINLAREYGDDKTRVRLINRYIGLYPEDQMVNIYSNELEEIRQFDTSLSGEVIQFDNSFRVLRLVSLSSPSKKAVADLVVDGKNLRIALDSTKDIVDGNLPSGEPKVVGRIKLDKVDVDKVEIGAYCMQSDGKISTTKENYFLKVGEVKKVCRAFDVMLDDVDVEKAVKLRLNPKAGGSRTETNFSVYVGIEKRAIKLTPDKVAEKIENLNKTIKKWENIAKNLGKLVTGLKGACFATAALLTFKNFMTGLSGEAIARQEVMNGENGWKERCKKMVASGKYVSMDSCYFGESSKIDAEVTRTTAAINKVNAKIQQIQATETKSVDLFGKSVDTDAVRKKLAAEIKKEYGAQTINLGDKTWRNADGSEVSTVTVNEILSDENVNNGLISTEGMRSLMLNAELQKQGNLDEGHRENVNSRLVDIAERVNGNMVVNWEFMKSRENENKGYPAAFEAASQNQQTRYAAVKPITEAIRTETGMLDPSITHIAVVRVPPGASLSQQGDETSFAGGMYVLGLEGDPQTGTYSIKNVVKQGETQGHTFIDSGKFSSTYNLGNIKSIESVSYQNEIQKSDRYVRYYENEPYKGMPAIVPFDTKAGWYAATQQTLPAFGGIGAFDASGRVTSFWICNVGKNGRIQFDSGFGDDLCQQINLNTGQPLNAFPGLDSSRASALIERGRRAIMEAANQYGNKYVTIGGERFEVGAPMTGTPSTQCQDFMSPKDCHLLFNVCDPVVCPPSRCNLGGTYHVANVAQTGIIGSIFLCLPNIREGILIPVCLTGIHAGIEGWISILKNYRDCLQENLNSGKMVGICDQIYSIYLCEFFWNQIAPFVNLIIPKLIEMAYGQGVRGGAEYLSVMSAWQNMEKSINYFTQSYAANSFKAFQARGVQEIGAEVCKSFISVKAPTELKTLLEPDSPPQFHAWFDEKTFTSATVPATSQYKVFYHIFAGKDQGVFFNVYLKNPPISGYYAANPVVQVASGFVPKGEYKSETRDFTAPQGYKELCVRVNNQEECGFKQVSTSFAINYLRDQYMKSEATRVTITSQKECVSGSNNPAALLTPNLQQGAEEFVSPELYNRGIIRICSTENPGSKTDPSRFVDVGYCDTPQVRCWLDQRSVEQAITKGNVGTLNETLEVLEQRTKQLLEQQNLTYSDSEAANKLMLLKSKVKSLRDENGAFSVINEANTLLNEFYWNRHKAEALILRGDAQAWLAMNYLGKEDEQRRATRVVQEKVVEDESDHQSVEQKKAERREAQSENYSLDTPDSSNFSKILLDGKETGVLYKENKFYDNSNGNNIFVAEVNQSGIIVAKNLSEIRNESVKAHISALNGKNFSSVFRREPDGPKEEDSGGKKRESDNCKKCGRNLLREGLCDFDECKKLGNCYFVQNFSIIFGFLNNYCYSCTGIKSCSDYGRYNKLACEKNMCNVSGHCEYKDGGECVAKQDNQDLNGGGGSGSNQQSEASSNGGGSTSGSGGGSDGSGSAGGFNLDAAQINYDPINNVYSINYNNKVVGLNATTNALLGIPSLPNDLNVNFEGSTTYLDVWKKLCEYKNNYRNAEDSCEWDENAKKAKVPKSERFVLKGFGNKYILYAWLYPDSSTKFTDFFIINQTNYLRFVLKGTDLTVLNSASAAMLNETFDGRKIEVVILRINQTYTNALKEEYGVSLCNFKSFVRQRDGTYKVKLDFQGGGTGECQVGIY